jgi:hypothetical protein
LAVNPNLPVQKTFYTEFATALYGERQTSTFEKRLSEAFAPLCNPLPVIDWEPAANLLKTVPTHAAITVIKTWANSWTTSARFHDGKLVHCCFGCDTGDDSIEHYLVCAPLWRNVSSATGYACAEDVLERICISAPTRENLVNLLVASITYHTVKHQYLSLVWTAQATNEWATINELAEATAANANRTWASIKSKRPGSTCRLMVSSESQFSGPTTGGNAPESKMSEHMEATEITPTGTRQHVAVAAPAGVAASPAPGHHYTDDKICVNLHSVGAEAQQTETFDFCEPECSDLASGTHHPSCVVYLLALEEENLSARPLA